MSDLGFQPWLSPAVSGQSSSGSGSSSSSSSPTMIPGMMGVYNQLLGLNQQNYGNVLGAYNKGQNFASGQLPGIYGGYGDVNSQVQNTLGMGQVLGKDGNWGVAQPAATAIGNTFAQQNAQNTQNMTNAGLGNTSVGANLQNQNALQAGQAYGALGAQLAQTAAGYQAQIGQAGLGARMQGLGMQTGLAGQEGGALAGYHYANTAGPLAGQTSSSQSTQTSRSQGGSQGASQNGGGQQGTNQGLQGTQGGPYGGGGGPGSSVGAPPGDPSSTNINAGAPGSTTDPNPGPNNPYNPNNPGGGTDPNPGPNNPYNANNPGGGTDPEPGGNTPYGMSSLPAEQVANPTEGTPAYKEIVAKGDKNGWNIVAAGTPGAIYMKPDAYNRNGYWRAPKQ